MRTRTRALVSSKCKALLSYEKTPPPPAPMCKAGGGGGGALPQEQRNRGKEAGGSL